MVVSKLCTIKYKPDHFVHDSEYLDFYCLSCSI